MSVGGSKGLAIDDIMGRYYNIQQGGNRLLENVIQGLVGQVNLFKSSFESSNEEYNKMFELHPEWKETHKKDLDAERAEKKAKAKALQEQAKSTVPEIKKE